MTLTEVLSIRCGISAVRLGARNYRVIRIEPGAGRIALLDDPRGWAYPMYADRRGVHALAAAWALAARSPRSLIWVASRVTAAPLGIATAHDATAPDRLDLVLVHHSLQFPLHLWKQVRGKAPRTGGMPHTAALPTRVFPSIHTRWERGYWYRSECCDRLSFDTAARTLFITGSRTAILEEGAAVLNLLTRAPAYATRHPPPGHYCVTIDHGRPWPIRTRHVNVAGRIHLEYSATWNLAA